jgi:hypothetical protein
MMRSFAGDSPDVSRSKMITSGGTLAACMRGWNEGRVGLAEAGCGGAVAADDCAAADCARNLRTSASVASRCARFI